MEASPLQLLTSETGGVERRTHIPKDARRQSGEEGQRPEASSRARLLTALALRQALQGHCPPGSAEDLGTKDSVSGGSLSAFTGSFLFGRSWYCLGTREPDSRPSLPWLRTGKGEAHGHQSWKRGTCNQAAGTEGDRPVGVAAQGPLAPRSEAAS